MVYKTEYNINKTIAVSYIKQSTLQAYKDFTLHAYMWATAEIKNQMTVCVWLFWKALSDLALCQF